MSTGKSRNVETHDAKLRSLLRNCARKWRTPGVVDVHIEFSRRMRTSLGRCYPRRKIVRLSEILLLPENEDLITEVACHEVAHVAAHELYGDGCRPHGPEWSKLVRAAGFQPRLSVAAAGPEPRRRMTSPVNVLYEHRCRTCNAMRTARRPMVHWLCSECVAAGLSGKLTIISRPAARKAKSDD